MRSLRTYLKQGKELAGRPCKRAGHRRLTIILVSAVMGTLGVGLVLVGHFQHDLGCVYMGFLYLGVVTIHYYQHYRRWCDEAKRLGA